ncbi:MAG: 3-oxoacyl-ACP reductase family protein [Pedobacter sp.]|uniref:SDR family NAD(P)-dependent oxidoreductase n=1 Tax=Pedobacter sp. TaxID=1411316 RepID=UPI002808C331|nr:3-oxoacyl-ACP reductase family protein [Pedobacter sp.]MDQ8004169.1 3-oxoacyl-ACP reductase family protein [Pedobacter sp.]
MYEFKDKIALVTGASQGLGKGIAIALAKKGATIIGNYIGDDKVAEETLNELKGLGVEAIMINADVSKEVEVERLFKEIADRYGKLDILINNAGTSQAKDIFELDFEDWNKMMEVNLGSGFLCSKKAMQIFKAQNSGRIVFVSSLVAQQGALYGHAHYAASKSGQLGLMKTLARTGASYNVTVNAVAPGIIHTELLEKIHGKEGVEQLAKTVPLGLGSVDDVGNVVAFLCADESKYLTGVTIDINGGMYIR